MNNGQKSLSVNETFIIEGENDGTMSACTGFFTNTIISCTGNTQILLGTNIIQTNSAFSATTFYGDGSNLTGISTQDTFVTGGTYNNITGVATFTNNTGGTFSITGFYTGSTDVYITGITFTNNLLTLYRNDGVSFGATINDFTSINVNGPVSATTYYGDGSNLTGISTQDTVITGGTYSDGATVFTNNTGGTFSVSGFSTATTQNLQQVLDAGGQQYPYGFATSTDNLSFYRIQLNTLGAASLEYQLGLSSTEYSRMIATFNSMFLQSNRGSTDKVSMFGVVDGNISGFVRKISTNVATNFLFNEPTVESNVNFPAPISSDTYNLGVSVNGKKFDVNGNVDIEIPSPYTPPTKTKFQDNNFSGDLIILDNIPIFIYYVSHNGQILMEGEDDDYTVIDNEITLNYSLSNRKIIVVYEY